MAGQIAASMNIRAEPQLVHLATGMVHSLVEGLEVRYLFFSKTQDRFRTSWPEFVAETFALAPRRQGLKLVPIISCCLFITPAQSFSLLS